jgi:hypothetical protein
MARPADDQAGLYDPDAVARNGELSESPANLSPPIGNVHGLGESHALRADLKPVQVPWFADEAETLRASVTEELAIGRRRARDTASARPR